MMIRSVWTETKPILVYTYVSIKYHTFRIMCTLHSLLCMFGCTKSPHIAHFFVLFAQVIVAVICMGVALVVCETDEKAPKETTPEAKESPAEKEETQAKEGDDQAEDESDKDCTESCEKEYSACIELCADSMLTFVCTARCTYMNYLCKSMQCSTE